MVLGNTGMGGSQAFVLNLLQNIDLSRFHFDFVVNAEKPNGIGQIVRELGSNIFVLPYFKVYNYYDYIKSWKEFLNSNHYDIIHGHSTNSASIYLKIGKEMGCSTIAHSHSGGYRGNYFQRLAKKYFAKKVAKVADYWFACSDKAALRLFGEKYRDYPFYFDIPNAINVEKYKFNGSLRNKIRNEIGIKDDELLCGHVGTFSQPKNHSFLIEIFNEVLKRNAKARLVCCGTGALMSHVKEKAQSLGILDKIIFTGVVMNVNEFMMAMDVFVFPSIFEGFPMSVVESEATGLPIVMSDVITSDVDIADLTHRKSLRESPSTWADAICNITGGNREKYNQVVVDSKYNIKTSVEMITDLYIKMKCNKS